MKKYFAILVLLIFALVSCTSTGRYFDADMVKEKIKIGESKRDDVLAVCGEPGSKDFDVKNDLELWHYVYVKKRVTFLGALMYGLSSAFSSVFQVSSSATELKSEKALLDVYFTKDKVVDMKVESGSSTKTHFK